MAVAMRGKDSFFKNLETAFEVFVAAGTATTVEMSPVATV